MLQRYPHPCPLPSRGRETLAGWLRSLIRGASVGVSLPLEGRGQGWGYVFRTAFAILLVVLCSLLAVPATAREAITSFASAITLLADGSVDVIETIEVNAEGYEIRRGIFRDIPLILINPDNSRLRSDLTVQSVTRDGRTEPYSLESIGAGFKRIRIGDADVFLSNGRHKYTIRYTMTRMGRIFADHDELFWNATGNYWNFPIEEAVASITLPKGAVIDRLVGYTGPSGSMEQAVTITRTSDNTAIFRVNRPLASGEGVSVAASFQKGILTEPEGLDALLYWLSDHRDIVVPGIAVGLVLLYNLLAWSAVGRDPKKGTIIPLFHPPKGFSPGLAEYVDGMGWAKGGWTAFTATIFDLGVKGLVKIDNPGKTLKVTVTGKPAPAGLTAAEQMLYSYFTTQRSVTVDKATGPELDQRRAAFVEAIEIENRQVYFRNNTGYVVLGVALSVAFLLAMLVFDLLDPITLVFAGAGALFLGILAGILRGLWRSPILSKIIFAVWAVIFGGNLFGAAASFLGDFRIGEFRPDMALIGAASIIFINVVFALLMRAPTVQGRKVMDQLDGFKMYMNTAEKNRLNMTNEPPMTVERFERILPYAIALGVEKPWSEHFEGELARNAVADASGSYSPGFYTGRNWSTSSGGFSNTVSSVASGMSAAMVAAQPSSSSGSGFSSGGGGGGGGGSGGGGGGGGGGGW